MKYIRTLTMLMLLSNCLHAQENPTRVRETQEQKIARGLEVSDATAKKVADIQNTYKAAVIKIMGRKNLDENSKRTSIDLLIAKRNLELSKILNPAELNRFNQGAVYRKRSSKTD